MKRILNYCQKYGIIYIIKNVGGVKFMAMQEKDYLEYLEKFVDTSKENSRNNPIFWGVKDFDFVDEQSEQNKLDGHTNKWCEMADKSYFEDYIFDVKNNPNSSFQTCLTREEIINDYIPEHFSVFIKEMPNETQVDVEILASRIMNYFGLSTSYNTGILGKQGNEIKNYLMSVDFLRFGDELVLIEDLQHEENQNWFNFDVRWFSKGDFKENIEVTAELVKNKLMKENIDFTKKDIDKFISFVVSSMLVRSFLMGDSDFHTNNVGILINSKTQSFRPIPNFDYECCFNRDITNYTNLGTIFQSLPEIKELFPNEYDDFIEKMQKFIKPRTKSVSDCELIAYQQIRDDEIRERFINQICLNAGQILQATPQQVEKM